jgi:hypothetical protein
MERVEFRERSFYIKGTHEYITKCEITRTGGGMLFVNISVCNKYNHLDAVHVGWMLQEEYKKLCIFLITRSGSTDLLGDPLNDHIEYRKQLLIDRSRYKP